MKKTETVMDEARDYPANYRQFLQQFPEMFEALQNAAQHARSSGPLDEKTTHLVQLAGAVAMRSEGAVHSHTKRAVAAGAHEQEIYQVVNLLISTVGFPTAAAAFSWVNDILRQE